MDAAWATDPSRGRSSRIPLAPVHELSEEARAKRDARRTARNEEQKKRAEWRRRENVRIALAECAGFVIPTFASGSYHVNKRWPSGRAAREECTGWMRCTDTGWSEANREVCRAWVLRTWLPAARLLARNKLAPRARTHEPADPYESETRRLFLRLLKDPRSEAKGVIADLAAVRVELAEDRRALGQYFNALWEFLRSKLEAQAPGFVPKVADRFQRAYDSVEWVRTVNPELAATLDPIGPWTDKALHRVWQYLDVVLSEGVSSGYTLPPFPTWASYVRKGRKKAER